MQKNTINTGNHDNITNILSNVTKKEVNVHPVYSQHSLIRQKPNIVIYYKVLRIDKIIDYKGKIIDYEREIIDY